MPVKFRINSLNVWPVLKSLCCDRNLFIVFLMGISSGLPFLLILSTLSVWLTEVGVSKTQIGLFAWVTAPYTLKFILAPAVDKLHIPLVCTIFGQRRGWIIISQLALMVSLITLGSSKPETNLLQTAICALLVGFCSAIQDIAAEAFRIEVLPADQLGKGAAASVLGWRVGMLCSGAGALYLAAFFNSWQITYAIMALLVLFGFSAALMANEPNKITRHRVAKTNWLKRVVITPMTSLLRRKDLTVICVFIISFKIADTVLNMMSMPFLIELGFSKVEIAHVAKTFGILAMIIGSIIGGYLLSRHTLHRYLVLCTVLQMAASLLFVMQAVAGYNMPLLVFTMGLENLTCGLSQVAIIAYLSSLCSPLHTASHYAILSSFASFIRINFSAFGGWVADQLAWPDFYILVSLTCIPSLFILAAFRTHFNELSIVEEMT